MQTADTKFLSTATSSFAGLRDFNQIYVDKTALIYDLASTHGKYLITRPRRFGKSLLISTFSSLFKDGLRYFKDLAIEKLWNDHTYPVVRLDFSEISRFSDIGEFKHNLGIHLTAYFRRLGFSPAADAPVTVQFSSWLDQLPASSLVLLIDEYDAPLTACLYDTELFKAVKSVISDFLNIIRSNDRCLRFFFMTGITRYGSSDISSGFSMPADISLDPKYSTLLGFTEDEIKFYYSPFLENASRVLNLPIESLLNKLRSAYGGYSFFVNASTQVCSPWAVLQFLEDPKDGFVPYWFSSGGITSALMKLHGNHEISQPAGWAAEKWATLDELQNPRDFDCSNPIVILVQAGYLTVRQVDENQNLRLDYPNEDVALSIAKLYARKLLANRLIRKYGDPVISDILKHGSIEDAVTAFNKAIQTIDYLNYPIGDEAVCCTYLQVILIGAALIPNIKIHNASGRSDMEITISNRRWVFAFKFTKELEDTDAKLAEAIAQLKDGTYETPDFTQKLIRVALVFCEERRQFTAFKEVTNA